MTKVEEMTKVKTTEYAQLKLLIRQRKTIDQISRLLNVSRSSIRYNVAQGPPSARLRKARSEKKKAFGIRKRRKLVRQLVSERIRLLGSGGVTGRAKKMVVFRNAFPSAPTIARELVAQHRIHTSATTVRRDLHQMGFRSLARPSGPRRMLGDVEERVAFSRRYASCDARYFLFSDEHIADTNDHIGRRQWCAVGELPNRREYYNWLWRAAA